MKRKYAIAYVADKVEFKPGQFTQTFGVAAVDGEYEAWLDGMRLNGSLKAESNILMFKDYWLHEHGRLPNVELRLLEPAVTGSGQTLLPGLEHLRPTLPNGGHRSSDPAGGHAGAVAPKTKTSQDRADSPIMTLGDMERREQALTSGKPFHRMLSTIAMDIKSDWGDRVSFATEPYLHAMSKLKDIDDTYYEDSARDVVMYFLANATGWRGPCARAVKAELNKMLERPQ